MIYHVRASLGEENAAALLEKLTDGSIAYQQPDGPELVASMERAVINAERKAEWSEMCLCPSPLFHERATVLDRHFEDIITHPIEAHSSYSGKSLMEHLRAIATRTPTGLA
jgi:hypothetical protein